MLDKLELVCFDNVHYICDCCYFFIYKYCFNII